jgi:uncharacterized membrane protein
MDWNRVLASFLICVMFFASAIGIVLVLILLFDIIVWSAKYINNNPEILNYWPIAVGVVIFVAVWTNIYKELK